MAAAAGAVARAARAATSTGVFVLACIALVTACGTGEVEEPETETIPRETFVETYVALRKAARASETGEISTEERERVLAEHGVTEEDLLSFVEVHGRRIGFMSEVWSEVEERLEVREVPGGEEVDTAGPGPPQPGGEEAEGGGGPEAA